MAKHSMHPKITLNYAQKAEFGATLNPSRPDILRLTVPMRMIEMCLGAQSSPLWETNVALGRLLEKYALQHEVDVTALENPPYTYRLWLDRFIIGLSGELWNRVYDSKRGLGEREAEKVATEAKEEFLKQMK